MAERWIKVIQSDIDNGKRGQCAHCPIALAGTRTFGTPCRVDTVRIEVGDGWAWLPTEAQIFIAKFDAGKPVQPFTFAVDDGLMEPPR